MKSWIACSNFLILFLSLSILFLISPFRAESQSVNPKVSYKVLRSESSSSSRSALFRVQDTTKINPNSNLPDPYSVLYKSMIIPGWGQVVNDQIWKVPIIYGLLGGLGWYSVYLTEKYHDYRAAYYNLNTETADDMRFGPTPAYIPEGAPLQQLKTTRNTFRNRRDLVYVGIAVAYGLNIVDAYVFAHMRSFDVSENLSLRPSIQPGVTEWAAVPGVTFSVDLVTK